ncbi:poly-gamma-glutamate hydrolase family protein [Salinigranum halophilum]|uniref:poly-gamma-glutamate hydrolase family protein n=1 Tax=Salinigranum halophilum TaxID=2565931 RepID=UPI00115E183C|nr:poly-gamma-glutamate hydrolase family protein [Salinigranum halophilum]
METQVYKARSDQTRLKNRGRRCSLSRELQMTTGVEPNHHIRVECEGKAAYYIVDQVHENSSYPFRTAKKGRERLGSSPGDTITISPIVPQEDYLQARRTGGFTETVWDDGKQDEILFIAPHGGDVEFGTDDIAIRSHNAMQNNGYSSSVWMCHGFNNDLAKDAFTRWHIKKPCQSIPSYPGLRQLSDRRFDYCVSFHMQGKDKERDEYYIGVGGQVDDEIRIEIAELLRERTGKTVVDELDEMMWAGTSDTNSVNYLSKQGGLQLELTPGTCYRYRRKVAQTVFDVFSERIDLEK